MTKRRPNVTVKLILKVGNEILILKEDRTFTFPGGRVEWNERVKETLKRELKEEIDYIPEKEPVLFDFWDQLPENGKGHYVMIYFALCLEKKPKIKALEGAEILWLTKGEFKEKEIIRDSKFLEKIFKLEGLYK